MEGVSNMRYVISIFAMAAVAFGLVILIQSQESSRRQINQIPNIETPAGSTPSAPGTLPAVSRTTISWQKDLDKALSLAKANHGKVVVDVYTDWCGWCKKMDQTIYTDPKVIALSNKHVFLKLNAEDGGQGQRFASRMDVDGYPTTIILDENGRSINSIAGYPPSIQRFIALIENS
jgi:thiol:disulfide interchange protein